MDLKSIEILFIVDPKIYHEIRSIIMSEIVSKIKNTHREGRLILALK
jgi:hypothetical protein